MAGSLTLWLCLHLCLLLADARSARSAGSARSARQPGSQGPSAHLDTSANPDSLWSSSALSQNRLLAEVLDLDQRRRSARGADEDEQQSTFGRSFENDFVTAPQPTQLHNITAVAAGGRGNGDPRGNASAPDAPGPSGPLHPLGEGSYGAYGVLLLAGLVLAVGVVGNMAVMCIVWNNYYMRSAWNYLLASMACWDFLVLVLCLPVVVLNQLSQRRMLGDVTCLMVPFMESVSLGVTSFTLCALGVDRFHAATSSSLPNVRRVERCRAVMLKLLLVWLAALLLSSPELFLWQLSQSVSPSTGQLVDSCTITPASSLSLHLPDSLHSLLLRYHQGRMWWCFGCYFCLPVVFTVLCQTATRNVNSESSPAQKQPGLDQRPSGQKRQRHQAVERQLNCTLLALAVVYGVCVLPEHVCNITLAYTRAAVAEDTAAMLALLHHFLLFFKSSVTPVLLLCLCKALGQVFMDCCCCCCQECPPAAAQAPPSSPQTKPKEAAEASIFFDKAKDTSAILSIPS